MNTIEVSGVEVVIPPWTLPKQMQHNNVIMPLIKDPIVNALACVSDQDADEALFIAAVLDGVMAGLASVDMLKVSEILLEGVSYRTEQGGLMLATLEKLSERGLDIADVLIICVNVIKVNYGALLKKDFSGSLQNLLMESPVES